MIFICGLNKQQSRNLTALLFEAGLSKLEEKRQQELEELLSKIESAEDFSLTSADRRIAVEPGKILEKQVRNWIRRTKPESLQAWADPRNIWLLEFWARLLPRLVSSTTRRGEVISSGTGGCEPKPPPVRCLWTPAQAPPAWPEPHRHAGCEPESGRVGHSEPRSRSSHCAGGRSPRSWGVSIGSWS